MNSPEAYIDVAIALPVYRTFTYAVPDHLSSLASVGKRVLAPFGQRRVTGYIMRTQNAACPGETKNILDILDDTPLFPASMISFFQWIADYYKYPIGLTIKSALPGGLNYTEQNILSLTDEGIRELRQGLTTPFEKNILKELKKESIPRRQLEKKLGAPVPKALIMRMQNDGWLSKEQKLKKDRIRPKMERFVSLIASKIPQKRLSASRTKIIDLLQNNKELSVRRIRKNVPHASRIISAMAEAGYVHIENRRVFRDPLGEPVSQKAAPELTTEQANITSTIQAHLGQNFHTFLLAGITGSGKTEVYLQLAATAVHRGVSVLVLVPEIALISQMERRFRARFGDRIAVLHSGLSQGERYDQWQKIVQRNVRIAIGARSAIFAPFDDLGLIIVDEEHDASYKQESSLRYHARDLAIVRAKQLNATALLGSATPSIQSYHNALTRKYSLVQLTKRVQQRKLPEIEIVDLCRLRDQRGHRRYISDELVEALKTTVDRGEQAILFLNRRGFANVPLCAACGNPIQCRHCDISMTYHQNRNAYQCHYCGFSMAANTRCPSCGSENILHLGFGTEKIESIMKSLFPGKRIERMDRDTIRHKGSIVRILKGLKNRTTDILIGTQMIAKGHDFPNITLVGIVCADLSLNFPDFRAGEQTYQLLAQVSGRAGRGDRPGKVILQTYTPENFSITCAKNQDFKSFYDKEIVFRQSLDYPPFSRMIQILVSSKDKSHGIRQIQALRNRCHDILLSDPKLKNTVIVMGPVEAPFSKIAAHYRWQMLLKGKAANSLHALVNQLFFSAPALLNSRHVKVTIDVDPVSMM